MTNSELDCACKEPGAANLELAPMGRATKDARRMGVFLISIDSEGILRGVELEVSNFADQGRPLLGVICFFACSSLGYQGALLGEK